MAGVTRYGTAAAIAGQSDFDGATTAILATGENFPDALAASGLAGDNAPAPIVLTESDNFTDETRVALSELGSLDDVIIVGGTSAVSDDVAAAVAEEGYQVTRLAGTDRYETAGAIADDVGVPSDLDGRATALIASGEVFADALAGGPLAYAAGLPILLVTAEGIPDATASALEDNDVEQVVLLGGTARISEETEDELSSMVGAPAIRVAGQDRFETAAEIARMAEAELGWAPEEVLLANGLNFPDALAGGPLGGERQAPILLTASVPQPTLDYLDENSDTIRRITALGGTAAISDEDLATAETAAETTDNDTPTGGDITTSSLQGPELQSASIADFDLDDLAITYTFVFDSELDEDALNPELFKLYNTDTRDPALGSVFNGGDEMEIDDDTAIVVFNLADYGVANATLAAVEEGAVEDENGNPNPPQSVQTSGVSNAAGAGLVSAEIVDEDDGIVDFEFSSPQPPGANVSNYFKLVTKDGHVFTVIAADAAEDAFGFNGTAENHPDEDEASTTVRVQFLCTGDNTPAQYNDDSTDDDDDLDNDPCSDKESGDGADLSDENIRRGVVESATTGRINTADIASGGTTDAPDLVDVQFASDNEDLDDNEALFIFDEEIDTAGTAPANAAAYDLVYSHCDADATVLTTALAAADAADGDADYEDPDGEGYDDTVDLQSACMLSASTVDVADEVDDDFSNRAVLVTFPEDDIDNDFLTAAQVSDAAAVSEADAGNLSNDDNEVNLHDSQPQSLWDDGEVSGPQLIGAEVEVETSFGGEFDQWVITLTFDKEIDDIALASDVSFWYDDGENVEEEVLAGCEVDDDTNIVCEVTDEDSDLANATVVSVEAGAVVTDDTFTLGDEDLNVQFPNPEASIEVEVPDAPDTDEA